jgi:hypothetical protein
MILPNVKMGLLGLILLQVASLGVYPYQVQGLYEKPSINSKMTFSIPSFVKLTVLERQGNWVKLRATYPMGGGEGWTYIYD